MAVTYALIDPIMTVVRPVAATITAIVAGLLVNAFPDRDEQGAGGKSAALVPESVIDRHPDAGSECGCGGCCTTAANSTLWQRFSSGMSYAFDEMISDIGKWLLVGVVVAGVIAAVVPDDALARYAGGGFVSYLVMLMVALPLYVCATASTPIAASLLLKGLSPGAALVFLLAGPATNGATITVMLKTLGKRAAALYVTSIIACSLVLAWLVDRLYIGLGLDIRAVVSQVDETLPEWAGVVSAVAVLLLVARAMIHHRHHHACAG
jgi:uncharacterized membrane protein YraQ (UPF0718 family)